MLLVSPYDLSIPGGVQGQATGMALELASPGPASGAGSPRDLAA